MKHFLTSNSTLARFGRTIAEFIVGWLIANIDIIIGTQFSGEAKTMIVSLTVGILTIVAGYLSDNDKTE